jgi:hypothetical protein
MIQAEQPVSCWKYLSDGQKRPDSAIDALVKAVPFQIRPRQAGNNFESLRGE